MKNFGKETLKSIASLNKDLTEFASFIQNSNYIPRNVIAVVTRNIASNPLVENFPDKIKALVETHATQITGLSNTFYFSRITQTSESEDKSVELMFDTCPLKFQWPEKAGKSVQNTVVAWFKQYEANPSTDNTIDIMFIETDGTYQHVVDAWWAKNVLPQTFRGRDGDRSMQPVSLQQVDVSCTFTALFNRGDDVNTEAQTLLDSINLTGANPHRPLSFVKETDQKWSAISGVTTPVQLLDYLQKTEYTFQTSNQIEIETAVEPEPPVLDSFSVTPPIRERQYIGRFGVPIDSAIETLKTLQEQGYRMLDPFVVR